MDKPTKCYLCGKEFEYDEQYAVRDNVAYHISVQDCLKKKKEEK
jgi:hypothetical protein